MVQHCKYLNINMEYLNIDFLLLVAISFRKKEKDKSEYLNTEYLWKVNEIMHT